ncbi:hypothetical protein ALQ93_200082 [Pseudomonas syringae pv. pisi]|nr:hypothetical protein ALQ93_200082 [Pseudomonas syringae pv. pisi]
MLGLPVAVSGLIGGQLHAQIIENSQRVIEGDEQGTVLIFNAALPENVSADWRKQRLGFFTGGLGCRNRRVCKAVIINHMLLVDVRHRLGDTVQRQGIPLGHGHAVAFQIQHFHP